jgi:peptide-methionine (S)-S-oxide reductase
MKYTDNLKPLALIILIGLAGLLRTGSANTAGTEVVTVAGGCFWCVESDFEAVPGVIEAVSGFTGGTVPDPTYKLVKGGGTGHFESVQIFFDPLQVSRTEILALFIRSVDPTDAGGQFCDRGDNYRTAIFVSNAQERAIAVSVLSVAQTELGQTIVTPVLTAKTFYPASDYHQNYYQGTKLILTRYGPKRQAAAYVKYRAACGRDARVRQLWGDAAPFAKG